MNDWTSETRPDLLRITCVTVAAADLAATEAAYRSFLRLDVAERGRVDGDLARSWGAPAAQGAAYVLLVPQNEHDVFYRIVETPCPEGYRPLTTYGWNAFEIIVDDVHALAAALPHEGFRMIGEPRPLNFIPSIVAMQVIGPASECLYFTMESGDRENSILPPPKGLVGRTFIVVTAGEDFSAMLRWWVDTFKLRERPVRQSKVAVLQDAQGLDPDQTIELSAIGMRERGNLVEIDGYPHGPGFVAGARPVTAGHLPPGNALVTLEVEDIEPWRALSPDGARCFGSRLYGGRRSLALRGPAGEGIELVEAAR